MLDSQGPQWHVVSSGIGYFHPRYYQTFKLSRRSCPRAVESVLISIDLICVRVEPIAFTHRNRNTETVDRSCRLLVVLKMGTYRLFESAICGGLEDYLVGLKSLFCQKS